MRQRATTRVGICGAAVLGLGVTFSGAALASGGAHGRCANATAGASEHHELCRSPVSVKTSRPAAGTRRRQGSEALHQRVAPQHAPADPHPSHGRHARVVREPRPAKVPCLHEPVGVERGFGGDVQPIALTRCDGRSAPLAVEQLSIVVRPMNAPRPTMPTTPVRQMTPEREWLPGVKLIHEGLITRLQSVVDHFHAKKVTIVSGYRPASLGSFHQSARAMDLHVDGVSNEALVAYCRSLPDTGCGYYPNSSFVHLDVRAPRSGHEYWIDASGPGEAARYVASWPLRDTPARSEIPRPDAAAPADEHTHDDGITRIGYLPDGKIEARTTAPVDTQEDPFTP
jgi:hypothetical protein